MIRFFIIVVISGILLVGLVEVIPFMSPQNASAQGTGEAVAKCSGQNLWNHTYQHKRFVELSHGCVVF